MMADRMNRGKPGYVPKHRTEILHDRYWLNYVKPVDIIQHSDINREDPIRENKKCWDSFYSLKEVRKRVLSGICKSWGLPGRISYVMLCLIFKRIYAENGISADSVKRRKMGVVTRILVRLGVNFYSHFFRNRKIVLMTSV